MTFTTGDAIAIFALVMIILKYVTDRFVAGEGRAAKEAIYDTRLDALVAALERLTKAVLSLGDQYHSHEIDCAKFRGQMVATGEAQVKTAEAQARAMEQMGRDVNQMQSQIRLVASKGNDRILEVK